MRAGTVGGPVERRRVWRNQQQTLGALEDSARHSAEARRRLRHGGRRAAAARLPGRGGPCRCWCVYVTMSCNDLFCGQTLNSLDGEPVHPKSTRAELSLQHS